MGYLRVEKGTGHKSYQVSICRSAYLMVECAYVSFPADTFANKIKRALGVSLNQCTRLMWHVREGHVRLYSQDYRRYESFHTKEEAFLVAQKILIEECFLCRKGDEPCQKFRL